jgi:esterase/lipase
MNKWHILPGMGASSTMYNALRHKLDFEVNFINWPQYSGEKTYADVAQRVVKESNIENGDVIGGSSLGGMVALEIGQVIQPKATILMGSAVSSSEVRSLLTMISPLAVVTPISVVQILAGKQKSLVSAMFADADAEFIRAMCSYLRLWPGYEGVRGHIFRIHGKKDHIIPCPTTGCDIIDDAGHLLAITHARETAAFLKRVNIQLHNN